MYWQLVAIFAISLILLWKKLSRQISNVENLPPGPLRWPILGNFPQAAMKSIAAGKRQLPFVAMGELNKNYGPIASFQYGQLYTVTTDDFDITKEILCSEVWTGRHFDELYSRRSWGHPYGILFAVGDEWKEMRRFILRTLRDFGFGKNKSQESVMAEEVSLLTSRLEAKIDQGDGIVDMKQFFTISVLNVLWSMMTGTRFSHEDEKLKWLNSIASDMIKKAPIGGNLANAYPILTPLFHTPLQMEQLQNYFRDLLIERRQHQDYKEDQRDFVEVFLKEIDDHKGKTPNYYTDEQFIIVLMDLFLAGSETTANTLEFAILYMILNPDVQSKVQAEIDKVVGSSRAPTANDKPNMPYTEATLLEIQRHANVLPIDSRSATEDTKLAGYNIPKGTPALLNLHAIHFSPKIWVNPMEFDPSRFLDKENNIINANKIMPFGAGKRVCIGESMARLTLFTYFTSLLQRYRFSTLPGNRAPSTEPILGFTLNPTDYSVQIMRR